MKIYSLINLIEFEFFSGLRFWLDCFFSIIRVVEYHNEEDMQRAIRLFDDRDYQGKIISVLGVRAKDYLFEKKFCEYLVDEGDGRNATQVNFSFWLQLNDQLLSFLSTSQRWIIHPGTVQDLGLLLEVVVTGPHPQFLEKVVDHLLQFLDQVIGPLHLTLEEVIGLLHLTLEEIIAPHHLVVYTHLVEIVIEIIGLETEIEKEIENLIERKMVIARRREKIIETVHPIAEERLGRTSPFPRLFNAP